MGFKKPKYTEGCTIVDTRDTQEFTYLGMSYGHFLGGDGVKIRDSEGYEYTIPEWYTRETYSKQTKDAIKEVLCEN